MKENPASSRALRFAAESIPASATTTMSVTPWRAWNAVSTGIRVVVSALLPSNRCTSSGNPGGFPLEVHLFEGNKAETTTLIPVLTAFQASHGVTDMLVVADAGMLSAANLGALEDAGFSFIVGSRLTKAAYDLAEHFERHGNYFTDAQVLESSRVMGTGKAARTRRIVYQWSFKRNKHDDKAIN